MNTSTMRKFFFLLPIVLIALGCGALAPTPTATPVPATATFTPAPPTAAPTVMPTVLPTSANLPQTEDAVPRVTAEEAKAAFDSGAAVIVDVRAAEWYAESHIPGALNIPLTGIELDPSNISLKKDRWIITYCT